MPRTFGGNQVHITQVVGWTEADYPLIEAHPVTPNEKDRAIAALVAERVYQVLAADWTRRVGSG